MGRHCRGPARRRKRDDGGPMVTGPSGRQRRVVVAITGASGAAYGVRVLELLRNMPDVETHLVVSHAAALTLRQECGLTVRDVSALADVSHRPAAVGASIAS